MRTKPGRLLVLCISLVFGSVLLAGDEKRTDETITRDANAALRVLRAELQGSAILLETDQGRLTLRGSVATERESERAAKAVGDIAGVVEVRNLLEVAPVPPPPKGMPASAPARRAGAGIGSGPERTLPFTNIPAPVALPVDVAQPDLVLADRTDDDEIRSRVQSALLDLDPRENAGVRVSVRDGVVWLGGTVATWDGNDARLRATRSVPGVRTIFNEVQVGTAVR